MKQDTHDLQCFSFAIQDCIFRAGMNRKKLRACFLGNFKQKFSKAKFIKYLKMLISGPRMALLALLKMDSCAIDPLLLESRATSPLILCTAGIQPVI
jgi:hypothetical protein